jgi:hypothetical protein
VAVNTAVLKRNNFASVGGREVDPSKLDWNRTDIKTLNIYQPPSPDNVLGNVKFVFPNKHDVYMHDTPQKVLFPKRVRAESHGCVRVEHPDQLALVVLQRDQGWNAAKVAAAIENGYDQHVALQEKIGPRHLFHSVGERRRLDLDFGDVTATAPEWQWRCLAPKRDLTLQPAVKSVESKGNIWGHRQLK